MPAFKYFWPTEKEPFSQPSTPLLLGLHPSNTRTHTMKVIDMAHMELVFAGEPWTHKLMPCSKQAIPLLERNEKIVSWVRPKGGDVTQHLPAIRYKDKFFTLSLRMQKAIYRSSLSTSSVTHIALYVW
jgi:hypothetical protein